MHAIEIRGLSKSFKAGRKALDDINLTIERGEMVALIGASGSGKSTLIRHCAGLIEGSSGTIRIGETILQKDGRISREVRTLRSQIGVVFQQFNLVGRLSVMTNVLVGHIGRMPLWRSLLGRFTEAERLEAVQALSQVGIAEQAFQRASTLSGGQQQRAAIARALTQRAEIILADEPIASLDPESARRVMEILTEINQRQNITVVVSLHQVDVALRYCRRFIALKDGQVRFDGPSSAVDTQLLRSIYGTDSDLVFPGLEPEIDERQRPAPSDAFPVPALA